MKRGRDFGVPGEPTRSRKVGTQKLKQMVARDFQTMIRLEAADTRGVITCVTCGAEARVGENLMDAGHFVSGRTNAILFDEQNCHPQCKTCNLKRGGAPVEYLLFMVSKYGWGVVNRLRSAKNTPTRLYRSDLLSMREQYRERIRVAKRRLPPT